MMKGPPQLRMVQLRSASAPTERTGVVSEVLVSSGGREHMDDDVWKRESLTY